MQRIIVTEKSELFFYLGRLRFNGNSISVELTRKSREAVMRVDDDDDDEEGETPNILGGTRPANSSKDHSNSSLSSLVLLMLMLLLLIVGVLKIGSPSRYQVLRHIERQTDRS